MYSKAIGLCKMMMVEHESFFHILRGSRSIDCGLTVESRDDNNFYYQADDAEFGEVHNVSFEYMLDDKQEQVWKQLNTLRSFPEGKRNCYTLKPIQGKGNNYLVRAYYMYGNYDHKNVIPYFEFHLGVNFWTESDVRGPRSVTRKEVLYVSQTDVIDVCLINTGQGTPFIALLELWSLKNSAHRTTSNSLPLDLMTRSNLGMSERSNFTRYPEDAYGRSWFDKKIGGTVTVKAPQAIDSDTSDYMLPSQVLSTAIKPMNGSSSIAIDLDYPADYNYYVYLHFFDFVERSQGMITRKIVIAFNDTNNVSFTLEYQKLKTILQIIPLGAFLDKILISSSSDSDLPPMINAYEIYVELPQQSSPTKEGDADAMRNIMRGYNIRRISWQGDPCMPSNYTWEGLTCGYASNFPRVTSLNLSSSKLTGEINASFSNLNMLESLDLSNNQLTGEIPQFLAKLPNLKLLNLTGNQLTGSIPEFDSKLILSLDGNPGLCRIGSCTTKTKKFNINIPLIASVAASVAILTIVVCISVRLYRRKKKEKKSDKEGHHQMNFPSFMKNRKLKLKNRAFNHFEVLSMTNDLETVIGEGGFGKVYLGTLKDDTQVAVKILSKSSQQGFNEFQSEAELLMIVHHRNLVSLVGYCDDGDMKALVYEYMNGGDLLHKVSDMNERVLTWNDRLHIALDASYGLDYLHNGCKPPIIHRDLKTSNILLNENMQAKIADFGLSKAFFTDTDSHISTRPARTFGYLDLEFHSTGNLNKKSDVYSFGIILLELMTGRPAVIGKVGNTSHISDWVTPKLRNGDIQSIMDPRLEGKFNAASAWRFLEMAMSCISGAAIQRPDISHVVAELKECLALEISLQSAESNSGISASALSISYFPLEYDSVPSAR